MVKSLTPRTQLVKGRRSPFSRRKVAFHHVWLGALLCVLAFAASASGRPFDIGGDDWEGCGDFVDLSRRELGTDRVVATQSLDYSALTADDGVVIVGPQRALDVGNLVSFMRAGGRVALLDDFGRGGSLLDHFGIRRTPLPSQPELSLRNNPNLAVAIPPGAHALTQGVTHVVTNHATGLDRPGLSRVLVVRSKDGAEAVLALVGVVLKGRLVAVGDASFVINSMMSFGDNSLFATKVIHFLVEDEGANARHGRLFIVGGTFDQRGAFGGASELGSKVEGARRRLADAWEDALLHGPPPSAVLAVSLAVLALIVAWAVARAGRPYVVQTPRHARPFPAETHGRLRQILASSRAPTLAAIELRDATIDTLTLLLKLDKAPRPKELVALAQGAGLVDPDDASWLAKELARLSKITKADRVAEGELTAFSSRVGGVIEQATIRGAVRKHPV